MVCKMDEILKNIGVLCITAYISGVVLNFTAMNRMQKSIRLVAFIYVLSGFFSGWKTFSLEIQPYVFFSDNINTGLAAEYIIEQAAESIRCDIESILKSNNISYDSIEVHIDEAEEGMEIDKITIEGADISQINNIERLLVNIADRDKIKTYE